MRNNTVGMSLDGAGLGDSSSVTGISTSVEPTLYGPVYFGKDGVGLSRVSKVMAAGWVGSWLSGEAGFSGSRCVINLSARKNDALMKLKCQ